MSIGLLGAQVQRALPRGREGGTPFGPGPPAPGQRRRAARPRLRGGTLAKSFALGQGTPPGQSPPKSGIAPTSKAKTKGGPLPGSLILALQPSWQKSPLSAQHPRCTFVAAKGWNGTRKVGKERPEGMLPGKGQWEGPSYLPPGLPWT